MYTYLPLFFYDMHNLRRKFQFFFSFYGIIVHPFTINLEQQQSIMCRHFSSVRTSLESFRTAVISEPENIRTLISSAKDRFGINKKNTLWQSLVSDCTSVLRCGISKPGMVSCITTKLRNLIFLFFTYLYLLPFTRSNLLL